jgi:hypothetical protein
VLQEIVFGQSRFTIANMLGPGKFDHMRCNYLWLAACLMAFGCGGEVEQGPDGSGGQANSTGSDPASNGGGGKARLGSCTPGTPIAQTATCSWWADGLCYSNKEAACNCICPTDVVEVFCLSDFPEAGKPTRVFCT